jgi:hypothetical protein
MKIFPDWQEFAVIYIKSYQKEDIRQTHTYVMIILHLGHLCRTDHLPIKAVAKENTPRRNR